MTGLRCCFVIAIVGVLVNLVGAEEPATKFRLYIGTYSGGESKGIYMATLDTKSGEVTPPELAAEASNPSFVGLHPNGRFLYAVSEISELAGKKTGAVAAFAIEDNGTLKLLNKVASGGTGPCHISVDKTGRAVLVANYGGGSVSSLPIRDDGSLGEAASTIQHKGSSVVAGRQKEPHAHSINLDAANRFAFAADLGTDQVLVYKFDAATAKLTPHDPPFAKVAPGSGPRHFAFHPSGNFAYVINEITCTVTAFKYDAAQGVLAETQTVSTLPGELKSGYSTAEVVAHPSGKFLYGSNRGHDTIALFHIDPTTGKLTPQGHTPTGGKTPRNFAIDPSGQFLFAENQGSGSIHVFRIDAATGQLTATGTQLAVGSPVCIRFLPVK